MADSETSPSLSPSTASGRSGAPLMDDVITTVAPETADVDPRRRNRKVLIRLCWVIVSSLVLFLVAKGAEWLTSEHDAKVAGEAEDTVDRQGPAFSASVRTDTDNTEATLFDEPFSAREKQRLVGPPKDLRPVTAAHHGRGVFLHDVWNRNMGVETWGYSEAWLVDIISDRKASLVINDMRMKGLRCAPARATTVIYKLDEGGAHYNGMLFDTSRPDTPLITDDTEHYGEPFFQHKKIDLGNGASPGGLRIQVTSGTNDCTWKAFEVTYVDSQGTHTQDITNNGKGFAVHGIAAEQKQVFEFSVIGIAECAPRPPTSSPCVG
ncbi:MULTISPECIES: hypothetical protein [unclassified Streptomyces]|uniref:hypothetical protein n=1 Tax=unclassified Streptomyces TaxID=2593676 RepID=UPI002366BEC5|nr:MULTISPECIES: hypothetical protein [unclassified Streptomyces]MDF3148773.1 hypothetical protein [Streptomyces sp. T21Q-yed]WDF40999.1 hypothetical protein PBV52_31575 [Streptomyces sp. T12]